MIIKKFYMMLILIFFMPLVLSIRISEVELNPESTDAGNEWVELYSEDAINLSEYKLVNNDGGELVLGGSFSNYYIYTFEKQWLDNSDEKIFLYNGGDLIDETILFKDDKDNMLTWQLCESWEFKESTKGIGNNCGINDETNKTMEEELNLEIILDENKESSISEASEIENIEIENKPKILETIKLTPKDIKNEKYSETLNKNTYAIGLVIFCILLIGLFLIRKGRYKNEFQK